jgi:hypothetical protein
MENRARNLQAKDERQRNRMHLETLQGNEHVIRPHLEQAKCPVITYLKTDTEEDKIVKLVTRSRQVARENKNAIEDLQFSLDVDSKLAQDTARDDRSMWNRNKTREYLEEQGENRKSVLQDDLLLYGDDEEPSWLIEMAQVNQLIKALLKTMLKRKNTVNQIFLSVPPIGGAPGCPLIPVAIDPWGARSRKEGHGHADFADHVYLLWGDAGWFIGCSWNRIRSIDRGVSASVDHVIGVHVIDASADGLDDVVDKLLEAGDSSLGTAFTRVGPGGLLSLAHLRTIVRVCGETNEHKRKRQVQQDCTQNESVEPSQPDVA